MKQTEVSPEQTGREAEHEISKTLAGTASQAAASGADPAGSGNPAAALYAVSAGIRSGISPLQFMDSIDAGGRQLGNRAFMHWVGQLHAGGQAGATRGIAAQGLQGPGRPLTHLDTLQRAFGHHDIRGMREHTGAVAGSALDALDAEGYTRGGRMALAGTPDLYTQAHEAAHGVQQAALGERMALPGGIGVAGDRYERQADAVARAVLRGESAQPLLDRGVAGPVQVHAAPVSATAPVQMKRKKHRRNNAPGQDVSAAEEEARELVDLAGEQDVPASADDGVNPQQLEVYLGQLDQLTQELTDFAEEPAQQQAAGANVINQQSGAALEQVAGAATNLPEQPDVQPLPAGDIAIQRLGATLAQLDQELTDFAEEPAQQQAAGGEAINEQPGDEARGYQARIIKYLFPGAQPKDEDDARGARERYLTYFFPALTYLYACLKDRANQVQTDEHGACSLRGILNLLATVMFGVLMVFPGLPLDVINNFLGGVAKFIVMASTILGLPADWLLKLYQKVHPPDDADRARAKAEDALIYLPRHIPEWLITLGFSGYFQAAISQGSLSPSRWLQPWTPLRIAVIIARSIADLLFVNILFGGLAKWVVANVLKKKLDWGPTRATATLLSLPAIIAPVVDYISSYVLNPELSIYLTWENIRSENEEFSDAGITAAFIGYAALGMFLQYLAGVLLILFLLARISAGNDPWRKQFYAISNRLLRYIAIFLASSRNIIINILSLSNFAALVVTNIIGPLAREFGQGGACIWPLAAADVCGELPFDFDLTGFAGTIETGKDGLPSEHLDIIRAFPALVGLLGLGIPIATIIALLCRKRWAGRGAAEPGQGAGRADRRGRVGRADRDEDAPDQGGRRAARRGRPRRTRLGTPVPVRWGRTAAGRDRIRLVEEDAEAGRRSADEQGEESAQVYGTIPSLPGAMHTQRQRRRPPPSPPVPVKTGAAATTTSQADDMPAATTSVQELIPAEVPGGEHSQEQQASARSGASPVRPDVNVQKLLTLLRNQTGLTRSDMDLTVQWYIVANFISEEQADSIKRTIELEGLLHETSRAPQELPPGAAGEGHSPEQPEVDDSFATLSERAQQIYVELFEMKTLRSDELRRIVENYWKNSEITSGEAETIIRLIIENQVLSKN